MQTFKCCKHFGCWFQNIMGEGELVKTGSRPHILFLLKEMLTLNLQQDDIQYFSLLKFFISHKFYFKMAKFQKIKISSKSHEAFLNCKKYLNTKYVASPPRISSRQQSPGRWGFASLFAIRTPTSQKNKDFDEIWYTSRPIFSMTSKNRFTNIQPRTTFLPQCFWDYKTALKVGPDQTNRVLGGETWKAITKVSFKFLESTASPNRAMLMALEGTTWCEPRV